MIGYIVALLPLYILVWLPIQHMLFGSSEPSSDRQTVVFNSSFVASNEPLSCPPHSYNTFILSQEPLIIYIESFLSADESAHLIKIRSFLPQSDCKKKTPKSSG
jgi:prolyl 4-hydroxylase